MTTEDIQAAKSALQTLTVGNTGLSMTDLATVFVKSGFFKDVREQAQAVVKVLLGQELGLQPIQAMMGIHIVEGKPEISAALMAALVKRSGRYDYEVKHHDDEGCAIEFFVVVDGKKSPIGVSEFTMHDAQRAGLANRQNWKGYPRNMCFARAMSNGVKWYCGDAVGGLPIYTDGEISDAVQSSGQPAIKEVSALEQKINDEISMPKEKLPAEGKPAGDSGPSSDPHPSQPRAGSTKLRSVKKDSAPSEAGQASTEAPAEAAPPGPLSGVGDVSSGAGDASQPGPITFEHEGETYTTNGMTLAQFEESIGLVRQVETKGKGLGRILLAEVLGVDQKKASRTNCTEQQAAEWIAKMKEKLA